MKRFAIACAAVLVLGLAPAALAGGTLSGKYTTTIKGSSTFGGFFNGKWVIDFKRGTYHVTKDGSPVVHGKDAIKNHVITFHDSPGPQACKFPGKYRFTLKGKKLTFKLLSDSKAGNCAGRRVVLTGHTFKQA